MEVLDSLRLISGLTVTPGAPLSEHTRFRLGGPCRLLAEAFTEEAFTAAYGVLEASGVLVHRGLEQPGAILSHRDDLQLQATVSFGASAHRPSRS